MNADTRTKALIDDAEKLPVGAYEQIDVLMLVLENKVVPPEAPQGDPK